MLPYITELNKVHLLALHRAGHISSDSAKALAQALLSIEKAGASAVDLDPQREDSYFNYEAHLIKIVGPDSGGRMHVGRSRNDLNCAMDRLCARDRMLNIEAQVITIGNTLLEKAAEFTDVVMPGYTHMQAAQPISYGFYLAALASSLVRDCERLATIWPHINLSPLGSGALAGTTFHLDRHYLANMAGFDGLVDSTLDAVASRDFGLEMLAAFSVLSVNWSRIAQDYFVWVTSEFQSIDFPDSVTGTSSIMPQKKNPVVLEHLKGKAGAFLGRYVEAITAFKSVNFTNTIDGNRASMKAVWDGCDEMESCLPLVNLIASTARPNAETLHRRATEDFSTVTDLADMLYREHDIPFRAGHHIIGAVVRHAIDSKLSAPQITAEMINTETAREVGRRIELNDDTVKKCLDPMHSLESRQEIGAPSPTSTHRLIAELSEKLATRKHDLENRCQRTAAARQRLVDGIQHLLSNA